MCSDLGSVVALPQSTRECSRLPGGDQSSSRLPSLVGFRLRKSVKLGPLRVTASKRGVSTSIGTRWLRIGSYAGGGPQVRIRTPGNVVRSSVLGGKGRPPQASRRQGARVTLGASGFHYRLETFSAPVSPVIDPRALEQAPGQIRTASAATLAALAPDDVVASLQKRLSRPNLFVLYGWGAGIITLALLAISPVLACLGGLGMVWLGVYVRRWDRERRSFEITYDLEVPEILSRLAMASTAGQALGAASVMWHVHHAVATSDWKRNAGAKTLIRRTATRAVPGSLDGVVLNVETWSVPVGPQQLLFLPDRLLVWDGRVLAGVPYESLEPQAIVRQFIEDETVPADAEVVGTTWQYVNKQGGPDRRFANNSQLPVVRYGELSLTSSTGLKVFLQTSTVRAAFEAASALSALSCRARIPLGDVPTPTVAPTDLSNPSHPSVQQSVLAPSAPSASPASPVVDLPVRERPRTPEAPAPALMIVLRSLVAADRKIDAREIEIAYLVHRQLTESTDSVEAFSAWFRGLPATNVAMAQALRELAGASPDTKRWILELLEGVTLVDGKKTAKEAERLSEIRSALS